MKKKKLTQEEKEEMKGMIYLINNSIMEMLGIHPDKDGYIVCNWDGSKVLVRGKALKIRNISKEDVPFRPVHNAKLMMLLNGMLTSILAQEGRYIEYIQYGEGDRKVDKLYLMVKEKGYEPLVSDPYFNDALRYLDCMFQLNEITPPVDLERLDELMNK